MTIATLEAVSEQATAGALPPLRVLVLARLACEDGATRAELARDLSFAVSAAGNQRHALEAELAKLVRTSLATENRSRFRASPEGIGALTTELGCKAVPKTWGEMRDIRLTARALGIEKDAPSRLKGLSKPDTLRAEILGQAFGFRMRGAVSAAKLRSELALVALERAFGNTLKSGISPRSGLNAKTARLLACQLLKTPRDVGTDGRLVAQLSAEAAGSIKPDPDALRHALLARFAGVSAGKRSAPASAPAARIEREAPRAATGATAARAPTARPLAASRPGLDGFVAAVQAIAREHAEGWPGNRKALVSRVWTGIAHKHPGWGLSAIEFKAMLAEAHRTGHLVLATADLKDKRLLRELQDSAIAFKNTVFHLIRIED